MGDVQVVELTYGDIIRRVPTDESPDLPERAVRCDDPVSELTLLEFHLAAIRSYLSDGISKGHNLRRLPYEVTELPSLHPRVEGYDWYRGYQVATGEDSGVIVFAPWMLASKEGGSPAPILYQIGEPQPLQLQEVAFAYGFA